MLKFLNALAHLVLRRILLHSPTLQMRKLSVRKDEGLDQGRRARKEQWRQPHRVVRMQSRCSDICIHLKTQQTSAFQDADRL